jgi:hypothetical protein
MSGARVLDRRAAQNRADMIGSVWRLGSRHDNPPGRVLF